MNAGGQKRHSSLKNERKKERKKDRQTDRQIKTHNFPSLPPGSNTPNHNKLQKNISKRNSNQEALETNRSMTAAGAAPAMPGAAAAAGVATSAAVADGFSFESAVGGQE